MGWNYLKLNNYKIKCNENLKIPNETETISNGALFDLWRSRVVRFMDDARDRTRWWFPKEFPSHNKS